MDAGERKRQPGICPGCGGPIATPKLLTGMWSGAKKTGTPAGGAYFEVACGKCGTELIAYEDVYDDDGHVPIPDKPVAPELVWGERRSKPSPQSSRTIQI